MNNPFASTFSGQPFASAGQKPFATATNTQSSPWGKPSADSNEQSKPAENDGGFLGFKSTALSNPNSLNNNFNSKQNFGNAFNPFNQSSPPTINTSSYDPFANSSLGNINTTNVDNSLRSSNAPYAERAPVGSGRAGRRGGRASNPFALSGRGRSQQSQSFSCRVCNGNFPTKFLLLNHLTQEKHFDNSYDVPFEELKNNQVPMASKESPPSGSAEIASHNVSRISYENFDVDAPVTSFPSSNKSLVNYPPPPSHHGLPTKKSLPTRSALQKPLTTSPLSNNSHTGQASPLFTPALTAATTIVAGSIVYDKDASVGSFGNNGASAGNATAGDWRKLKSNNDHITMMNSNAPPLFSSLIAHTAPMQSTTSMSYSTTKNSLLPSAPPMVSTPYQGWNQQQTNSQIGSMTVNNNNNNNNINNIQDNVSDEDIQREGVNDCSFNIDESDDDDDSDSGQPDVNKVALNSLLGSNNLAPLSGTPVFLGSRSSSVNVNNTANSTATTRLSSSPLPAAMTHHTALKKLPSALPLAQKSTTTPTPTSSNSTTTAVNNNNSNNSNNNNIGLDEDDDDGVVVGTCEDMCPAEERKQRIDDQDVHKLERPPHISASAQRLIDYESSRATMIKKCKRSAADHKLNVAHWVRTPKTLLNTLRYLESCIMDKDRSSYYQEVSEVDGGGGSQGPGGITERSPSPPEIDSLELYLFVWDRLRMIAKDFIMQNYRFGCRVDVIAVECHERMARWFIMMEHQMQSNSDFVLVHAHQNKEQLNKVLKTLNEFYDHAGEMLKRGAGVMEVEDPERNPTGSSSGLSSGTSTSDTPVGGGGGGEALVDWKRICINEAEFRGYYSLCQLYNPAEVQRYLSRLSEEVLQSEAIQFVLQVARALSLKHYASFFKLLRQCNYLQACCLFKYICEMRLQALRTICWSYRTGRQEAYMAIDDLVTLLMFEDRDDAIQFILSCGLEVTGASASEEDSDTPSEPMLIITGQNLDELLPVHPKSGDVVLPVVWQLVQGIESRVAEVTRETVCRGALSGAAPYESDETDDLQFDSDDEDEEEADVHRRLLAQVQAERGGERKEGPDGTAAAQGLMTAANSNIISTAPVTITKLERRPLPSGPLSTVSHATPSSFLSLSSHPSPTSKSISVVSPRLPSKLTEIIHNTTTNNNSQQEQLSDSINAHDYYDDDDDNHHHHDIASSSHLTRYTIPTITESSSSSGSGSGSREGGKRGAKEAILTTTNATDKKSAGFSFMAQTTKVTEEKPLSNFITGSSSSSKSSDNSSTFLETTATTTTTSLPTTANFNFLAHQSATTKSSSLIFNKPVFPATTSSASLTNIFSTKSVGTFAASTSFPWSSNNPIVATAPSLISFATDSTAVPTPPVASAVMSTSSLSVSTGSSSSSSNPTVSTASRSRSDSIGDLSTEYPFGIPRRNPNLVTNSNSNSSMIPVSQSWGGNSFAKGITTTSTTGKDLIGGKVAQVDLTTTNILTLGSNSQHAISYPSADSSPSHHPTVTPRHGSSGGSGSSIHGFSSELSQSSQPVTVSSEIATAFTATSTTPTPTIIINTPPMNANVNVNVITPRSALKKEEKKKMVSNLSVNLIKQRRLATLFKLWKKWIHLANVKIDDTERRIQKYFLICWRSVWSRKIQRRIKLRQDMVFGDKLQQSSSFLPFSIGYLAKKRLHSEMLHTAVLAATAGRNNINWNMPLTEAASLMKGSKGIWSDAMETFSLPKTVASSLYKSQSSQLASQCDIHEDDTTMTPPCNFSTNNNIELFWKLGIVSICHNEDWWDSRDQMMMNFLRVLMVNNTKKRNNTNTNSNNNGLMVQDVLDREDSSSGDSYWCETEDVMESCSGINKNLRECLPSRSLRRNKSHKKRKINILCRDLCLGNATTTTSTTTSTIGRKSLLPGTQGLLLLLDEESVMNDKKLTSLLHDLTNRVDHHRNGSNIIINIIPLTVIVIMNETYKKDPDINVNWDIIYGNKTNTPVRSNTTTTATTTTTDTTQTNDPKTMTLVSAFISTFQLFCHQFQLIDIISVTYHRTHHHKGNNSNSSDKIISYSNNNDAHDSHHYLPRPNAESSYSLDPTMKLTDLVACTSCLSIALNQLALASSGAPYVVRAETFPWIETTLQNALWTWNEEDSEQLDHSIYKEKEDIDSSNHLLLSVTTSSHHNNQSQVDTPSARSEQLMAILASLVTHLNHSINESQTVLRRSQSMIRSVLSYYSDFALALRGLPPPPPPQLWESETTTQKTFTIPTSSSAIPGIVTGVICDDSTGGVLANQLRVMEVHGTNRSGSGSSSKGLDLDDNEIQMSIELWEAFRLPVVWSEEWDRRDRRGDRSSYWDNNNNKEEEKVDMEEWEEKREGTTSSSSSSILIKSFCERLRSNGWKVGTELVSTLRKCVLSSIPRKDILLNVRRTLQLLFDSRIQQLEKKSSKGSTRTTTISQQVTSNHLIVHYLFEATKEKKRRKRKNQSNAGGRISMKITNDMMMIENSNSNSNSSNSSWMKKKWEDKYIEDSYKIVKKLQSEKSLEYLDFEYYEDGEKQHREDHVLSGHDKDSLFGWFDPVFSSTKRHQEQGTDRADKYPSQVRRTSTITGMNMIMEREDTLPPPPPISSSFSHDEVDTSVAIYEPNESSPTTTTTTVSTTSSSTSPTSTSNIPSDWLLQLRAERSATERLEAHLRHNVNEEWDSFFFPIHSLPTIANVSLPSEYSSFLPSDLSSSPSSSSPIQPFLPKNSVSAATLPNKLSSALFAELFRKRRERNDDVSSVGSSSSSNYTDGISGQHDRKRHREEEQKCSSMRQLAKGNGNVISKAVLKNISKADTTTRSNNKDDEIVWLLEQCREENIIFETILEEEERIRKKVLFK